jgi:hypothetical protein
MNIFPKLWESYCPVCIPENKGYIYDQGFKFWSRLALGNNRFACRKCRATWRRKNPFHHSVLQNKDSTGLHSKSAGWPKKAYLSFISEFQKNFWACCFVGILSVGFVYAVMHIFPRSILELAPHGKIETQITGKQAREIIGLRNDKLSGKQELLIRRNGK